MINIPTDVMSQYSSILAKKLIPVSYQHHYKKWLRYYLDFCHKYGFNHLHKESLDQFIKKLLGHKDVSTTMIYAHVINKGGMGVQSPLDML